MKKQEFIKSLAETSGTTQAATELFLQSLNVTIKAELGTEGNCRVPGLGVFRTVDVKAREMKCPSNGKVVMSKAKKAIRFKASKRF
jgi:nucleoid DNA-binding protein